VRLRGEWANSADYTLKPGTGKRVSVILARGDKSVGERCQRARPARGAAGYKTIDGFNPFLNSNEEPTDRRGKGQGLCLLSDDTNAF